MFYSKTQKEVIEDLGTQWLRDADKLPTGKAGYLQHANEIAATDLDAAAFIRAKIGNSYTYIPTSKSSGDWYFWNGKVHERDPLGLIDDYFATAFARYLKSVVAEITLYMPDFGKDENAVIKSAYGPAKAYAKRLHGEGGHANLRKRIQNEFLKAPDYFDQDQRWAVMADGRVIDLENLLGEFLEPDASRPVTKKLGICITEEEQGSALWQQTLDKWLPDTADQKYLQVAAGAALMGQGSAKNIVTLVGLSNTGKSTYIRTLAGVFGGYAGSLPANAIVLKYGGATNFDQYKARGKRFLYLEEPQNTRTDDSFLKNLAGGGGEITTQEKGKNVAEWRAQCVLHIGANHVPKIDATDNAIVERLDIIPFDHVFSLGSAERVEKLEDVLLDKAGVAILKWILNGAREYDATAMIPKSDEIKARGKSNAVRASAPLKWLEEVTGGDRPNYVIDTSANSSEMVKPGDVYPVFTAWCDRSGEHAPKRSAWLEELERHLKAPRGFREKRSGGYSRVFGILPGHTSSASYDYGVQIRTNN